MRELETKPLPRPLHALNASQSMIYRTTGVYDKSVGISSFAIFEPSYLPGHPPLQFQPHGFEAEPK